MPAELLTPMTTHGIPIEPITTPSGEIDTIATSVAAALTNIEARYNTTGWDQPPAIIHFTLETTDNPHIAQHLNKPGHTHNPDCIEIGIGATLAHNLTDQHPADWLIGKHAPDDIISAAIIFEAWGYPQHIHDTLTQGAPLPNKMPSTFDDRRELRFAIAAHRDGAITGVSRYKETHDVAIHHSTADMPAHYDGRLLRNLQRYININEPQPATAFRDWAAATWGIASLALAAAHHTNEPSTFVDVALATVGPDATLLGWASRDADTWQQGAAIAVKHLHRLATHPSPDATGDLVEHWAATRDWHQWASPLMICERYTTEFPTIDQITQIITAAASAEAITQADAQAMRDTMAHIAKYGWAPHALDN